VAISMTTVVEGSHSQADPAIQQPGFDRT